MDACSLFDVGRVGNKFTWHNKRKKKPIFQRLDRAWVNMHWLNAFPSTNVHTFTRDSSDHNPIKVFSKPLVPTPQNLQIFLKWSACGTPNRVFQIW